MSVEAKVLIDFAGYKGFVSCFVPGARHAIADYIELLKSINYGQPFGIAGTVTLPTIREFPGELQVKNLPNTIELMARFYGDPSWTPLNEIPTSTRVFIYSESDLEDKDILVLKEAGKTLGHQVQFRSPMHAMERLRRKSHWHLSATIQEIGKLLAGLRHSFPESKAMSTGRPAIALCSPHGRSN